jgi:NADPH:quinone reductase-like Zn-dependent oxidoreductase
VRAIVMDRVGGPEVLAEAEADRPVAGPGQVLVRTEAVGVGWYEMSLRDGTYPVPGGLPTVFGCEAAGTVVEVGEGADPGWVGRRVTSMDIAGMGTYAEYVAVPEAAVCPIPDAVSAVAAVAAAVPAATALALWERAAVAPGATVLVQAAAGGVGGYLTQLARARGAGTVIATAGSAAKRERAWALGAHAVVDHRDPDWPDHVRRALDGGRLDVVFEAIGGPAARRTLDLLVEGTGRVLLYGMLSGEPPTIGPADLLPRGLTVVGCGGLGAWAPRVRAARADVLDLVARGELEALVDSTMPLAEAAAAHRRVEDRLATGKVVLLP